MSIHHQDTTRVANAIAKPLNADIGSPEYISPQKISDYDLIGFGSGIYFGRFHSALRLWIDELPDESVQHRKAFVFSTSGLPFLSWLWHRPLKSRLRRKGFEVIGEFHSSGFDTVGPLRLLGGLNRRHPDECDLENAAIFARQLLVLLADSESAQPLCPSP